MVRKGILCALFIFAATHLLAQQPIIQTRVLKDSLFIPWELIYGIDNHLWFTQKNGYICRMDTAGKHTDTLLHEPATVTIRESGMLGMAMHPDFDISPYIYVAWEYLRLPDSAIFERISRYTFDAGQNKLIEPYILLDSIKGGRYHNGCRLQISGGQIYMTIADAADSASSQDITRINGKVLRLNLDGSIPSDNPVTGSPVWTWGHRNQQGLVFANGVLYSSEHGPNTDDEVNILTKGGNYGWPYVRGVCDKPWETSFCADSPVIAPIYNWTPTIAPCGMDYYNGEMFPEFQNSLLMATLKDKHLYCLHLNSDYKSVKSVDKINGVDFGRLRDICISPEGKIYLSTSNSNADGKGPFIDRIIQLTNPDFKYSTEPGIQFYPNPTKNYVNVVFPPQFTTLDYLMLDATGRSIVSGTVSSLKPRIHMNLLPSGYYKIVVFVGGRVVGSERIVHIN